MRYWLVCSLKLYRAMIVRGLWRAASHLVERLDVRKISESRPLEVWETVIEAKMRR